MADGIELDPGSGGATVATDDDGSFQHQYVKVEYGADDTQTKVTATDGLPIQGDGTDLPVTLDGETVVLGAGSAAIGKLAPNSGVDIGDVDVLSVIPGTGATNLGKAVDSVCGATDTGVGALAKHKEDLSHLTTADGDYDYLTLDSLGQLHVNPEGHHVFDQLDVTTGWTVLGNDTVNLATTAKHALGVAALTFDKVDGAANTAIAGIQKTISSLDLGDVSPHDILQGVFYIPNIDDVAYAFARLGTDNSNYNEWQIPVANLTAATFETGALTIGDVDHDGITGTGLDSSAITYIALGVVFNAETDTLAGIIFDQFSYHTNQHVSAGINAEVTSSVSSANINLQKVGGSPTDKGAGNAGNGSQRVVLATDSVFLKVEDAQHATGDIGIMPLAVRNDVLAALAGTDGDYAPIQVDAKGAAYITGDVANDTADSGNPIKIGAHATNSIEGETQVANNDRVDTKADLNGVMLSRNATTLEELISGRQTNTDGSEDAMTAFPAQGGGIHNYITSVTISNAHASQFCTIDLLDGSGGTAIWTFPAPASGGATHNFDPPLKCAANTALFFDPSAATTTITVSILGFAAQG